MKLNIFNLGHIVQWQMLMQSVYENIQRKLLQCITPESGKREQAQSHCNGFI